jgi:RecA-family ATPase
LTVHFNPAEAAMALRRTAALQAAITAAPGISARLDQAYLVKGWLLARQISMIVGPSNVGKSFLALDIAHHVALGKDWHGRKVNGGEVLYIAAEGGRTFGNRVVAINQEAEAAGDDLSTLRLWLLSLPVTLTGAATDVLALSEAVAWLKRNQGAADFRLIVIDTMSRTMGAADENAAKDINDLIANLEALREATGAHILLVHHSGKDLTKGARGHSSLRAAVDTEITIAREDDEKLIAAKIDKQRDGETGAIFRYRLRQVTLGTDQDGDAVTSCVCEPIEGRAAASGTAAWDGSVSFTAPPEIGATIETPDGILTLQKVEPYTRKRDGFASFVLHWSASSGTRFTSGLAGKLTRQKEA